MLFRASYAVHGIAAAAAAVHGLRDGDATYHGGPFLASFPALCRDGHRGADGTNDLPAFARESTAFGPCTNDGAQAFGASGSPPFEPAYSFAKNGVGNAPVHYGGFGFDQLNPDAGTSKPTSCYTELRRGGHLSSQYFSPYKDVMGLTSSQFVATTYPEVAHDVGNASDKRKMHWGIAEGVPQLPATHLHQRVHAESRSRQKRRNLIPHLTGDGSDTATIMATSTEAQAGAASAPPPLADRAGWVPGDVAFGHKRKPGTHAPNGAASNSPAADPELGSHAAASTSPPPTAAASAPHLQLPPWPAPGTSSPYKDRPVFTQHLGAGTRMIITTTPLDFDQLPWLLLDFCDEVAAERKASSSKKVNATKEPDCILMMHVRSRTHPLQAAQLVRAVLPGSAAAGVEMDAVVVMRRLVGKQQRILESTKSVDEHLLHAYKLAHNFVLIDITPRLHNKRPTSADETFTPPANGAKRGKAERLGPRHVMQAVVFAAEESELQTENLAVLANGVRLHSITKGDNRTDMRGDALMQNNGSRASANLASEGGVTSYTDTPQARAFFDNLLSQVLRRIEARLPDPLALLRRGSPHQSMQIGLPNSESGFMTTAITKSAGVPLHKDGDKWGCVIAWIQARPAVEDPARGAASGGGGGFINLNSNVFTIPGRGLTLCYLRSDICTHGTGEYTRPVVERQGLAVFNKASTVRQLNNEVTTGGLPLAGQTALEAAMAQLRRSDIQKCAIDGAQAHLDGEKAKVSAAMMAAVAGVAAARLAEGCDTQLDEPAKKVAKLRGQRMVREMHLAPPRPRQAAKKRAAGGSDAEASAAAQKAAAIEPEFYTRSGRLSRGGKRLQQEAL